MSQLQWGIGSVEWAPYDRTSAAATALVASVLALAYVERNAVKNDNATTSRKQPKRLFSPTKAETLPLLGTPPPPPPPKREWLANGTLCAWMLCCSVAIIYTNAFILDDRCPYPATLTAAQQGAGFLLSALCVYGFRATEPVDLTWSDYCWYVLPLAVCFAAYLWGSNAAYIFLSPGILQMIKPFSSVLVFAVAVAWGLERYTTTKLCNLVLICSGVALTAVSKLDNRQSSPRQVAFGLAVLGVAYALVAFYNLGLQILQRSRPGKFKLNPLTTLLYVAPAACVFLAVYAGLAEWPLRGCRLPVWLLAADCLVAFVFNLSMMLFIGRLSAVSYSVFAFLKEIVLVLVAFLCFRESISRAQIEGYLVTLAAVLLWQARQLYHTSS